MLVIFGVTVPIASAYVTYYGSADMWLVDANTHKTASTINLYGKAADSGKKTSYYLDKSLKGVSTSASYKVVKVKLDKVKDATGYHVYKKRPEQISGLRLQQQSLSRLLIPMLNPEQNTFIPLKPIAEVRSFPLITKTVGLLLIKNNNSKI